MLWVLLIVLTPLRPTKKSRPVSPPIHSIDDIYSVVIAPIPPAPQMTVSSLAARPRSSLVRAGSLTEAKLTANASRRAQKLPARQDSYDSSEWSPEPEKRIDDRPTTASSVGPVAGNGAILLKSLIYLLTSFTLRVKRS